MGEVGEALVLMHSARERFRTVRATLREWYDRERGRIAEQRFADWDEDDDDDADLEEAPEEDEGDERVVRLWLATPSRVREERERGDGRTVGVRQGERWWRYDPERGVSSNEADPRLGSDVGEGYEHLLDPSPLIGVLDLESLGRVRIAGREAIRLRGTPRSGSRGSFALARLGPGADGYELAVDAERGVLLRAAAMIGGDEYAVTEVVDVAFDETFAPETFTLTLPQRLEETPRPDVEAEEMPLDEAARRAPFPVWAPATLGAGWLARSTYFPGDERSGDPPTVAIRLVREDASHYVRLVETASDADNPFDDMFEWRRVVRGGEEFYESVPERRGGLPTRVRLDRDGTRLLLESATFDADTLLEFARSLVRIPR